MTSRADVVAYARSLQGIRYRHQGRSRYGLDCFGVVAAVALDLQLISRPAAWRLARQLGLTGSAGDTLNYSRFPDGVGFQAACDAALQLRGTSWTDAAPGTVALFWRTRRRYPQHAGVIWVGPDDRLRLIHSDEDAGAVTDHALTDFWRKRLVAIYDFPGVTG